MCVTRSVHPRSFSPFENTFSNDLRRARPTLSTDSCTTHHLREVLALPSIVCRCIFFGPTDSHQIEISNNRTSLHLHGAWRQVDDSNRNVLVAVWYDCSRDKKYRRNLLRRCYPRSFSPFPKASSVTVLHECRQVQLSPGWNDHIFLKYHTPAQGVTSVAAERVTKTSNDYLPGFEVPYSSLLFQEIDPVW